MFGFRHGRLGSAGTRTLIQRAIASLRARGTDAHLWLPGVGTLSGLQTGNYLESTGNTLATVDNPCGLVLDALGTVGAELVTNGGFDTDSGWTKETAVSIASGGLVFTATANGASGYQSFAPKANTLYKVVMEVESISSGGLYPQFFAGAASTAVTTVGTHTAYIKTPADVSNGNFGITANGTTTAKLSSISVREVTGIHLTQATTANKPIVQRGLWNLLTYSSDFSNAAWPKWSTTVVAGQADHNGGATAYKLVESMDGAPVAHLLNRAGATASTPQTLFALVKPAGRTQAALQLGASASYFDISAGSVVSGNGTIAASSNGYYGIALSLTPSNTNSLLYIASSGSVSYTGDGASGILVDGLCIVNGTLTAAQILAAGGIPVTTTAAASNPDAGKYSWAFDSTDLLSATIPAGWETATVIDAAPTGAVASVQNVVGTHSIRGAMVTGVNLVTNGDFSSATGWVPGAGWSIGSGVITASNTSITTYRDIGAVTGKTYIVSWDVVTATAGVVAVTVGGAVIGYWKSTAGSFSEVVVAAGNPNVELKCSGFTGSVDNISVYEINPVTHARILVKGTLTDAETNLYKSLANSFK